ncbi:TPA: hypothetical protein ACI7JM_004647, partial [Escherichia coli]
MAAPWISSPEMAMRDPGQGGRHRQTWRWSTPARIVGCGDASSRSVATAGDLVPSSAMAMLQLDVRGLVVSASSDAAMLERGEKKPPRGVRGGKSACGSGRKKGTVAKLAMRQPFVLFKGLTFQKLCLPGAFRPGDHHN